MLGIFSKTRTVSRNGLIFQVPLSNLSRTRFLVHPDGTGTGWSNVEAVDIDQPHGLDYRYSQHIAKGVRKRINKEHKAFGDNTAGGEHKPGGCAILDIVDQTIDISIDDDTYKGRNILYDQTGSSLWCFTNTDGTASTPDGYRLMWGPKSICSGGDYTWTGAHEFDATVDFSNVIACASDVEIAGDISIDGTSVLQNTVITGDSTFTFDPIAGETGPTFNILGDWSARAKDTVYQARTDGMIHVTSTSIDQRPYYTVYTDAATPPTENRARARNTDGNSVISANVLVKKGDYWKVTDSGTFGNLTVLWIPFGDNT